MSFPLSPQQAQQTPPDSVAADTLAPPPQAAADTLDTFTQLNRDLGEAGDLLLMGEWELFLTRLYEGLASLVVGLVPRLFGALLVFVLFYLGYSMLRTLLQRLLKRSKFIDAGLEGLLLQTFRLVGFSFIA
ncbi:MAG: hypothetical protein ACE10K_05010, partial [Rhodothermales bacterium]